MKTTGPWRRLAARLLRVRRLAACLLLPEAQELALATYNADFSAPGCAEVLRPLALALLVSIGERSA